MSDEFERTIGMGDSFGTRVELAADAGDDVVQVSVLAGLSGGRGFASPATARQLSAALLDAADYVEEQS